LQTEKLKKKPEGIYKKTTRFKVSK